MSDIFLSYKSEDKAKAQIIAAALERKGYSVWWDRIIPIGRSFDEIIEKELNAAKCVVVLWSEKSVKAKWVITEAGEGDSRGILIPVLIEEVKPPLAFRRIEAAKLMDWDGTSDHEEFDLLLDSISGILGQIPAGKSENQKPVETEIKDKEEQERLHDKREEEERGQRGIEEAERIEGERQLRLEKKRRDIELKKKEDEIARAKTTEKKQKRSPMEKSEKTFINSIGMKFTLILAGDFMMGSDEDDTEKPVHKVTISKPFYLGVYPVTQQEWNAVMMNNPSKFKGENLPVENVSWDDVQEFIDGLNEKEGTDKYRLPSEAEWEYSARAGTTTRYSFGDDESNLGDYAWYESNSNGHTQEIGQKKPNPWDLYDMNGNVWEWVQDEDHDDYNGAPTDGSPWENGVGSCRIFRGGSWSTDAEACRSASHCCFETDSFDCDLGFRLLRIL